jgi:hypothetical protein
MGNKNCTTWKSILFPENDEEEVFDEWMKNSSDSLMREYVPSYPGTEILPVQPVYEPGVRELQFRHENEKAARKRPFLFIDRDTKNESTVTETIGLSDDLKYENTNDNNNIINTEQSTEKDGHEVKEIDTSYKQQQVRGCLLIFLFISFFLFFFFFFYKFILLLLRAWVHDKKHFIIYIHLLCYSKLVRF